MFSFNTVRLHQIVNGSWLIYKIRISLVHVFSSSSDYIWKAVYANYRTYSRWNLQTITYCSLWGGMGWSVMSRFSERWRRRESHPISWQKWVFLFQIIMLSGAGKMYRRTRLTRYALFWTAVCPMWWNLDGILNQSRKSGKNKKNSLSSHALMQ